MASHRSPRARTLAGACLAALALALLLAAPAGAEHRKFRLGAMDDTIEPAGNVRGMGAAGARVFRTLLAWNRTEVNPGAPCERRFDWSYYDRLVAEAGSRGVRVVPFIAGSPRYAASEPSRAPHTATPAIHRYKCFVREAVARYGRGGKFIRWRRALYPRTRIRPITAWQVWNEPNLPKFATDRGVNPREYARLVKVTRKQIVRQDRRATIVLAGLPELTKNGFTSKRFLRKLYRVKRIERKFDALALHPYAASHRGVKGALIRLRRLLRRVGDRRRPVWMTEVGWASHGPRGHWLVKGPKGQARQLTKTFRMLRRNRRRFKVGTVTWFRWRDQASPAESSGSVFDYAGLYRKGGRPKRSCRRFVRFTGGRCTRIG